MKKKKKLDSYELTKREKFKGDALAKTAEILRTQPENIVKTLTRFKKEVEAK